MDNACKDLKTLPDSGLGAQVMLATIICILKSKKKLLNFLYLKYENI